MSWIEFNPEPNFRDSPKTATGRLLLYATTKVEGLLLTT